MPPRFPACISDITTLDPKLSEMKEGGVAVSGVDFNHDNGVIK